MGSSVPIALQTLDNTLKITSFKQSAENAGSLGFCTSSNRDWWQDGTHKADLWGNPDTDASSAGGVKSIFDPCPRGWKVSSAALLTEVNDNGAVKTGEKFYVESKNDSWFCTGYRNAQDDTNKMEGANKGLYFADNPNGNSGRIFEFNVKKDNEANSVKTTRLSSACGIRCMKDIANR